jgi:hypothetical protein
LIGAALEAASAGRLDMPAGYTLDEDGLYWLEPGKDGAEARPVRLSDPFDILGEARDGDGGDWGLLLRFWDRDGWKSVRPSSVRPWHRMPARCGPSWQAPEC